MRDVFLFDDDDAATVLPRGSARREVPRTGAGLLRGLELLSGVQLLLAKMLDAIERLGGDSNGHASCTRTFTPGVGAYQLKCATQFKHASAFTVQFDVSVLGAFAQATVEWRLGGSIIQRQCDVAAGVTISGFAESVSVSVADITNLGTYAGSSTPYNVTVTIAPIARPTTAVPPVYTAQVATALNAGATTGYIQVPNGANGVMVYGVSAGNAATLNVDHYTGGTGLDPVAINSTNVSSLVTGFIPLIAGVSQLKITNEGAAQALVSVIFSVDG